MLNVTAQDFATQVLGSKQPIIVDFWAEWCQPCKMLGPIFEKVSKDFAGRMTFAKLNVDTSPQLAQQFDVRGIPCMIIFRNGKETDRLVGALSEGILREKVNSALKGA